MTRRQFLLGTAVAAAVPSISCDDKSVDRSASGNEEWVWIVLEAFRPWHGERIERRCRRMITVSPDVAEDWGEFEVACDEEGKEEVWFGDDENGYWRVEQVFEFVEPTVELFEYRYPVCFEIPIAELIQKIIARYDRFCE